jgi:hypothetical protein
LPSPGYGEAPIFYEQGDGGIGNLKSHGASARVPYWLSLFADLSARSYRPDTARVILDAALADRQVHEDMWWLPE